MSPVPSSVVVDASAAVGWFVWEPGTERAQRLRDAAARGNVVLHAPDLWLAECANAIWKKVQLAHALSVEEGAEAVVNLARTGIVLGASADLLPRAYALATTHRCTVYDALYLALAQVLDARLATADAKLAQLASAVGIVLVAE